MRKRSYYKKSNKPSGSFSTILSKRCNDRNGGLSAIDIILYIIQIRSAQKRSPPKKRFGFLDWNDRYGADFSPALQNEERFGDWLQPRWCPHNVVKFFCIDWLSNKNRIYVWCPVYYICALDWSYFWSLAFHRFLCSTVWSKKKLRVKLA